MELNGKSLRLRRLFRKGSGRLFAVPMDHTFTDGPLGNAGRVGELAGMLAEQGADCIVLHKGRVRYLATEHMGGLSLIVHLSGSTAFSDDSNAKVLVGSVTDAVRLGADAVSVHVNIGCRTERDQLIDCGAVAEACATWGMPLLVMMYARGANAKHPTAPETLAHLVAIATDLGADLVKTNYSGSPDTMRDVVATSSIPLMVAGGVPRSSDEEVLAFAEEILASGATGLAMGRNVFGSKTPEKLIRSIADLVHQGAPAALAAPRF
ncbi:2-amino-3,7-dideoxy-D-threo-hept-6-ulosonate synthase [Streptomyces sp. NPDC087658]|uniref:2-amino-3,7-dideoxy-D-threo-hept-6-ulosonate synthase n=1 Tax=Streptomyces sp. NPDC087658 TaxID=3365800 RepID=UPI0037F10692